MTLGWPRKNSTLSKCVMKPSRNDCLQVYSTKYHHNQFNYKSGMYGSYLEETRTGLESIEVLEQAIVSEMLALQDNPK